MHFELALLNLFIGMCRGTRGLPRDLFELGYRAHWIELLFSNDDLEQVCPELIIASASCRNTILFEWKSGANTDADQLRRYSRVSSANLVDRAWIRPGQAAETHDITLVGQEEHADRLLIGVDTGGYHFPVVVADADGLRLIRNAFRRDELNRVFTPRLAVRWDQVTRSFVPVDMKSRLWEVAEVVIPHIVAHMQARVPHVTIERLCSDTFRWSWDMMGRPGRDQLKSRVGIVVDEALKGEFGAYMRMDRGHVRIDFVANPLDVASEKRVAAYRRLQAAQRNLLAVLRGGAAQLPLPFESREDAG